MLLAKKKKKIGFGSIYLLTTKWVCLPAVNIQTTRPETTEIETGQNSSINKPAQVKLVFWLKANLCMIGRFWKKFQPCAVGKQLNTFIAIRRMTTCRTAMHTFICSQLKNPYCWPFFIGNLALRQLLKEAKIISII